MSYFSLLFKKISKKKLTLVPIFLILIFIVVIYIGDTNSSGFLLSKKQAEEQQIEVLKQDAKAFKEGLKNYEPTSKAYLNTKYNIEIAEQRAKFLQLRLNAYESKHWKEYYENDRKLADLSLKIVQSDENQYSSDLLNSIRLDVKYAQYRENHNLTYEERFVPTQGISYTIKVLNNYTPLILVCLLIFIASNTYCASYKDGMEIHDVIPIHSVKKQFTKLLVGLLCGVIVFLFLCVVPIICGVVGNTLGSFQSPVLTYTLENANAYIPILTVLPQVLLISILSILFIVNFVSMISLIIKRNLICLIVSLGLLCGMMWTMTSIVPLFSIAHIVPTTYFSSLKVISGELMNSLQNTNVNFINGVIVLCSGNVILFSIYYAGSKFACKKVK